LAEEGQREEEEQRCESPDQEKASPVWLLLFKYEPLRFAGVGPAARLNGSAFVVVSRLNVPLYEVFFRFSVEIRPDSPLEERLHPLVRDGKVDLPSTKGHCFRLDHGLQEVPGRADKYGTSSKHYLSRNDSSVAETLALPLKAPA
jgi:hypothetical protein